MNSLLLTGSSGFLGSYLNQQLKEYFRCITIGRSAENHIVADFSNQLPKMPEDLAYCVHAAGKAHVYPRNQEESDAFLAINAKGTENLLNALDQCPIKAIVFISSVSVYGLSAGENISEDSELRGNTPYAKSKILAEEMIRTWSESRNCNYLILRLPLIAGVHPPGNLGKMIMGIQKGRYLRIARGNAHKSIVFAGDVARLISDWLGKPERTSGIFNLTDGVHPTFFELEEKISHELGGKKIPSVPTWFIRLVAVIGDRLSFIPINSGTVDKITKTFTFSDEKARLELGWSPKPATSYDWIST